MEIAKKKRLSCSIAIVDENGWLVALHRMDGAPLPIAEIARDKAWTAAVFRRPSSEVFSYGDSRAPGFGLNAQNWNDRLTTIPGGHPIEENGHLIGAIGVSSQTPREDVLLCKNILKIIFGKKERLDLGGQNSAGSMEVKAKNRGYRR